MSGGSKRHARAYLVVEDNVVFGGHVIGDVVVDNEAEQTVEKRQVDFVKDFVEFGLEQHHTLAVGGVPHIGEVVHALSELVHEHGRGFGVGRLHPIREQMTLIGLVPQVLIQIRVCDLLERLDVVHRDQVTVQIHDYSTQ